MIQSFCPLDAIMPEKPPKGETLPFRARDVRSGAAVSAPQPALTVLEMLERGFEYQAYCSRCDESRPVDLGRLVRLGHGSRLLTGRRLICRECGALGSGRVRYTGRRR